MHKQQIGGNNEARTATSGNTHGHSVDDRAVTRCTSKNKVIYSTELTSSCTDDGGSCYYCGAIRSAFFISDTCRSCQRYSNGS